MDEKKILEKIKESASQIDAPESLKPEHMEEMVQGRKQKRKRLSVYRMGAAAAALLLVFAALWQVNHVRLRETEEPAQETEAGAEIAAGASAEEAAETAAAEQEVAAADGAAEVIPHAASEEELYLALTEAARSRTLDAGLATGSIEDEAAVTEAPAEDGAAYETGKESSGDYSQTNLQEAGVDEADIIKTDGEYIYALSGGKICIVKADGGELARISEIKLPELEESVEEIYLDGDILVLIVSGSSSSMEEAKSAYYIDRDSYTKAYTYDISDRSAPKLSGSVSQEGYYRTSRKNGSMVYLFTQYSPSLNETQESSVYMPKAGGEALGIEDVYLPESVHTADYLVISSVDTAQPGEVLEHKAIVSGADLFYVSTENIYITSARYEDGGDYTQILKFSYRDGEIRPAAVGEVAGYLNDSFSMNEGGGYLRVVATDWNSGTELNHLYVLDEKLGVCGKIENLAPGETIRSARFFGDIGYFVTFRDTDPLFSVDLSNPEEPKILGELKVTGFSSYLHFYGENRLLGIGDEVDPDTGEYQGIKLSMFDISDPSDVKEIDRYVIEDSYYCPGIYNYKAIMINPEKNIFGFECEDEYLVFTYDEEEGFVNQFQYKLHSDDGEFSYSYNVRGLYIGETFYLSEDRGVKAFAMADGFAQAGELEY